MRKNHLVTYSKILFFSGGHSGCITRISSKQAFWFGHVHCIVTECYCIASLDMLCAFIFYDPTIDSGVPTQPNGALIRLTLNCSSGDRRSFSLIKEC